MRAIRSMLVLRILLLFAVTATCKSAALAQATGSVVEILKVHSQNEQYYLKSIPYDREFPTTRGVTSVYREGSLTPIYVLERGFDSVDKESNNLILSNDGQVIFYAIPWEANEEKAGLKSVTIYRNAKILRSFTETEITGCDKKKERCSLLYSNNEAILDKEASNFGSASYKKTFKAGVNEQERFLSDFPIFSFDDIVYLTDSKKRTHLFDLSEGSYIKSDAFENVFPEIKAKGRFHKVEVTEYDAPFLSDFPRLKNGGDTYHSLANALGMKPASIFESRDQQYRHYSFKINSNILRDGTLEIEDIEFWGGKLPQDKVIEFFATNKFDTRWIHKVFDKWNLGNEYFYLRKSNDIVARQEKQAELREARKDLEKRRKLDTINGVYIPVNILESFGELDKLLADVDKMEMKALPNRDDMIQYHHGLGTWLRNNWGLWGGSRLQEYFSDRGITHPDEMSSVILEHYHDWLTGKKETWKDWEKNPKSAHQ